VDRRVTDVTERKRADLELRERGPDTGRSSRYSAKILRNRNFRWVSINENLARDFGFRPEEVVARWTPLVYAGIAAKYHPTSQDHGDRRGRGVRREVYSRREVKPGSTQSKNADQRRERGDRRRLWAFSGTFTGASRARVSGRPICESVSVITGLDHVIFGRHSTIGECTILWF